MAVSSKVSQSLSGRLWNALSAWTIRNSGYQKLGRSIHYVFMVVFWLMWAITCVKPGLLREDLYDESATDVKEAIRRLPEKEQQLRLFRMKRALDLSLKHNILPKDQWTTPEQVRASVKKLSYKWHTLFTVFEGHTIFEALYWPSSSWVRWEEGMGQTMRISPDLHTMTNQPTCGIHVAV